MGNYDDADQFGITEVRMSPVVVDGFDVIIPKAPIGQAAIAVHSRLLVAEIVSIPFIGLTTSRQLVNVSGVYLGHSLKEATGTAAAAIDLYDGTDTTGILLNPVTLLDNESTRDWYPLPGIVVTSGIWADVTSGEVTGVVYFGRQYRHDQ